MGNWLRIQLPKLVLHLILVPSILLAGWILNPLLSIWYVQDLQTSVSDDDEALGGEDFVWLWRLGFLMSSLICVRYFGLNENVYGRCIGDLKGLFGLLMVNMQMLRAKLKIFDVSYGHGTANTALVYHHQKLLALSEGDKPYAIKILEDGDLQTLGMLDYDKRLGHNFTAHPKVDPFTGEMFTLGYSHTAPYVTYREMVKNKTLIFSFDSTKKARFGVLPWYAKDEKQYQMV
ncbi:Dixin [Lathyrus oleraceus]|uniref:carotenoid 9,10-dioxygenase n=1 Tax=Pisum sativum TaxID=3888 RepID=A0A9D4VV37_PEA|nr:Dixin [Pisum sativum]